MSDDRLGLLCVHPHPDDETIACGGIIARYLDEGLRVGVVTCTGGEEGDNLAGIDLGDVPMELVRRRELDAALALLGGPDHHLLGYRDSGMAGADANEHPDSFHRADVDDAARRLAAVVRAFRPHVVVSDDDRGTYGHPDHVKAHQVTTRALALAVEPGDSGPAWRVAKHYVHALPKSRLAAFHERMLAEGLESPFGDAATPVDELPFGVPDEQVTAAVDVRRWLPRKRAAMAAHASQIGADSFFLNLPTDLAEAVFGTEHFVLVAGAADGAPEDDLFAGLRR